MSTRTPHPSEAQAPKAQRHAYAHNLISMTNEGEPMNAINHTLLNDHAVIRFSGELTWDSATGLADCIDTLTMRYFYKRIELVIQSPGGLAAALEYLTRCISAWRERGVHLRTRVLASAASAAAVLLSLGDERIAEPEAQLLYHLSRDINPGAITAHASAEIRDALARIDERIINQLVERTLREPDTPRPHQAEPSDLRILRHLVEATAQHHGTSQSRSIRHLAKALGCAVDAAARTRDCKALTRVYQALAETDRAISAPLARTLRLIDHIGVPDTADAHPSGTPGLTVPEWRVLYGPSGDVSREVLTRHALVLGDTGSGKTQSVIQPLIAAMVRAPRERLGASLIIDPKRDFGRMLRRLAPNRVDHITPEGIVLNVMVGERWRLDNDLRAGRWVSAATRILRRAASFIPSSPLRVLDPQYLGDGGTTDFFKGEGTRFLIDVLAVILMLTAPGTPPPDEWPCEHVARGRRDPGEGLDEVFGPGPAGHEPDEVRRWMKALHARARQPGAADRGPNVLTLCAWALDGELVVGVPKRDNEPPKRWLFAEVAIRIQKVWNGLSLEACEVLGRVLHPWHELAIDPHRGQYNGTIATARSACAEFATPAVAHSLYFGCERVVRTVQGSNPDFRKLVSRKGKNPLVLFQPVRDGSDNLVALALKALFFEAVLDDPDRSENGAEMPLVGYVADEFHRFVTSDKIHGEQSFLDTCRSFGAFCILATQSVASIKHALSVNDWRGAATNDMAVKMLCCNTATKFYFHTTETDTVRELAALCPVHPGLPSLVDTRPLATLAQGECYAVLTDGRIERHQLDRFTLEENIALTPSASVGDAASTGARRRVRRRRRRGHGSAAAR